MRTVRMKGIALDYDRIVKLGRADDGSLQVVLERSGTAKNRCAVTHIPCKCGKGRTKVHIGISDEAIQALFVLYGELYKKEQAKEVSE